MSSHHIGPLEDVPNRPGMRARNLAGSDHGFDSLFIAETEMDAGAGIPLHMHPIEEAWVVRSAGALTLRVGDETVVVPEGAVLRVPPHGAACSDKRWPRGRAGAYGGGADRATFFRDATEYIEGTPRK